MHFHTFVMEELMEVTDNCIERNIGLVLERVDGEYR